MIPKKVLHYIIFLFCSTFVANVLAQESEVSEPEETYFEPRLDFGGYGATNKIESPLNPGNFAGISENVYELAANVGVDFEGGKIRVRSALKSNVKDGGWKSDSSTQLLSIYKAFHLSESTNLTLGKKNIHLDSGFAFHPLDFFEDLSTIGDFEQLVSGEEGFPLVSFSHKLPFGAINAVYASDIGVSSERYNRGLKQALLSISNSGKSWDGMVLLQKYDISSVGFGGAFSSTPSEALAVNASFFLRPGSIRPFFGSPKGRAISLNPRLNYSLDRWWVDEQDLFFKFLIGAQYTFELNINLILEYFYDGDGVSGEEWNRFRDQVSAIQMFPEVARMGAYANGLHSLKARRQHYISSRLKFDGFELKPEIGFLLGENEGGQLNVGLQREVYSNILIWGRFSQNLGSDRSEFGLFPVHSSFSLGARWRL